MRGYILKGNQSEKEEYVSRFIKDNSIPSSGVFNFEEDLKIAEVREIKKNISYNVSAGAKLFVIKSGVRTEAQNALLKTLEELPDDITFIFSGERDLLPTISSRCSTIYVGAQNFIREMPEDYIATVAKLVNVKSAGETLKLLDDFFQGEHDDPVQDIILSLREILRTEILNKDGDKFAKLHNLLGTFIKQYPLISSNNLNPKMTAERIILEYI